MRKIFKRISTTIAIISLISISSIQVFANEQTNTLTAKEQLLSDTQIKMQVDDINVVETLNNEELTMLIYDLIETVEQQNIIINKQNEQLDLHNKWLNTLNEITIAIGDVQDVILNILGY